MTAMPIVTVDGELEPAELGVTICHEHCFIDLTAAFDGDDDRPVEPSLLAELRTRPFSTTRDNMLLDDDEVASAELARFAELGGRTVVDVTPIGAGRDPQRLRRLSAATGLNIVMGTAFYVEALHPPFVRELSVDALAALFEREIRDGVDGVRAGVIGELGVSGAPIPAEEEKVLRAGARAALATGAAVSLHLDPLPPHPALPAIDVLVEEGLPSDRIVAGHLDVVQDLDLHRAVAARGVFLGFDQLGCECYADELGPNFSWGHDAWRLPFIQALVDAGHGGQLLLSQDVAMKMDLRAYGGRGYAHVLRWVVPTLEQLGVPRTALDAMLVENPARAFALR